MPKDTVQIPCNANTGSITAPASTSLAGKSQPCTLQFDLNPNNGSYSWLATEPYGIEISGAGSEFTGWTRVSDTVVTVDDVNNDGATYTYTVSCNGPNGIVIGDPSIVNRGNN